MIPFNDLKPLHGLLAGELEAAAKRVLHSGWYILGPELEAFEQAFAAYHGVSHAVGVANGTDAIELALRALGIGPGDEVITVAHTAVATVCAVERTGATPVLVDIDEATCTLDSAAAAAAVTPRTKAIVPVHLYGHPADMEALTELAARHGLAVVEDCAQAHGARIEGRLAGTIGHLGAFSFYPTKNLGAYGDGGAVITGDAALAERVRRLRNYGQEDRYHHAERGQNSRLDEMQAALLRVKLAHLDGHNAIRRRLAGEYSWRLTGVTTPSCRAGVEPVFHLYVVRHPQRDPLMKALGARGIGTLIHYPVPVHLQKGYRDLGYAPGSLPVTERTADEILSLPLYVGLTPEAVASVSDAVNECARLLP
ncbi:MAG TPA: DegT/DnrJ/EryC1/StrS family aminotransferase [Thermoanaerobaculia bacterium]|nr:DegT/DnrJ/EryC1/StrS family aminotransferase [Thermoanaerobaculia bacterium]